MAKGEMNKWSFTGKRAKEFPEHIRKSVPMYEEFQTLLEKMIPFYLPMNGVIVDIGCSTGETFSRIQEQIDYQIQAIGIDNQEDMINEAKSRKSFDSRFSFICEDIMKVEIPPCNIVVSSLTFPFMLPFEREQVLKKVYESLKVGGVLFVVDKVYVQNHKNNAMFTQIYHDFKEESGFSTEEIRKKDKSLRGVFHMQTHEQNIEQMEEIGFQVDTFFQNLHFIGYLATKTDVKIYSQPSP